MHWEKNSKKKNTLEFVSKSIVRTCTVVFKMKYYHFLNRKINLIQLREISLCLRIEENADTKLFPGHKILEHVRTIHNSSLNFENVVVYEDNELLFENFRFLKNNVLYFCKQSEIYDQIF